MKRVFLTTIAIFLALSISFSQEKERVKIYNVSDGLALDGYDAVSYFNQNKAVLGKKEFSVSDKGVIYYFITRANKDEFLKNASKYEPQYGGWCAYAMGAKGEKVEVDPETFKILDGKLYLFYNSFTNNTLRTWNKDEVALKSKADKNWKIISKK